MANSNEYMRKYMLDRYYRRRSEALISLGGKCSCGSIEDLEIDHVDPSSKKFSIAKLLAGGSEEKVQKELSKCQLLCKKCHTDKSIKDSGKQKAVHGTVAMYQRSCRCAACRSAKSEQNKKSRLRSTTV